LHLAKKAKNAKQTKSITLKKKDHKQKMLDRCCTNGIEPASHSQQRTTHREQSQAKRTEEFKPAEEKIMPSASHKHGRTYQLAGEK